MKDQRLLFFLFLLIPCYGEETVAEDLGVHQIDRLVELLTSTECRDLLAALSSPEEDIFQHLQRLLPENNRLDDVQPRARRDAADADAREAECRTALTRWLLRNGEQTYYDRLSRGLQHVGRSDIAAEVGKNINQDRSLSLQRYVEGYHQHASRLKTLPARPERGRQPRQSPRKTARKVRALTWRDLDLVLERAPGPLRGGRGMLDGAWPLLYGLLLSVGGAFLLLHTVVRLSMRGRRSGAPGGSRAQGDGASRGPAGARRT